jgi:uncharacterized protein
VSRALVQHGEHLAVVRLGPGADLPAWSGAATLFSVTATATETSIVCAQAGVPKKARQEGPFTAFEVEGPLDFTLTGVLHELLQPLAEAQIPVFTLSTFDTDWILVPADSAARAAESWRRSGHVVRAPHESTEQPPSEGSA